MPVVIETAPAKINLTLEVRGRRADGYHELLSLVAFADVADVVSLDTEGVMGVVVSGPFAAEIVGPNLLDRTLALLQERAPELLLGAVHLEKRLPVAAGIGGGSANAAALLRVVAKVNLKQRDSVDWSALAVRLGADVAVCLGSRAAWMSGAGGGVEPLATALPTLDAVLVNPRAHVPADKTAQVFGRLGAPALSEGEAAGIPKRRFVGNREELMALLAASGNDLETPATAVVPELKAVMTALSGLAGVEISRLSGAGPTCFGIFASEAAAAAGAADLKAAHPGWWVEATRLS